ncbi:MAG: hypothetical protein RMZ41_003105 [Nostoc sp. DedVER02]|uniref:hypothetical protein n=1 Tax=unclassified Nostoc TaxID=2593658 RepID=UPI002AD28FAC|nr:MULTISPECIES: hypothetical protein [unclassified Nostoc]MDZ7986856.1 hypothetical protein [Nostoc sp. DedVER02]MDZ8115758.1 hypothetical protein [Nostoc sp. DedVER01b]
MQQPHPHPEVDSTNMIGWQPVFATNRPATSSSNQSIIPMLGLGLVALVLAAGGGVLFKVHQSMDSQKAVWQQEAIAHERSRIMECITPK